MRRRRHVGGHGLSAVDGLVEPDAAEIDHVRVVRVDADLAEVHRPRVGVVHLAPRRARIIRTIETGRQRGDAGLGASPAARLGARLTASRCGRAGAFLGAARRPSARSAPAGCEQRRPLDRRVEDARLAAVDIHGDASERPLRQAALELAPGGAAVRRLVEPAARAAAVHAARGPPALIHRRVQDLAVGRIHHDVVRAGVIVDLEHLRPGLAAVGGAVDAALAARAPQAPGGRHEHDVVVARVDDDPVDVLRGAKPHVGVGLPAVGRLVDAVAPRGALAVVRLARAHPDKIGVALGNGHVADRHQPLVLELRFERGAVVPGLPHAAVRRGDIVDGRVGLVDGDVGDAARHRRRPDRAEVERIERACGRSCGGRRGGLLGPSNGHRAGQHQSERQRDADETCVLHATASRNDG